MDYEQIRRDLEHFVAIPDGDKFCAYVDETTLKAKLLGEDLHGYYQTMLAMAKDLMTKDYILATSKHGKLAYENQDVLIFLDEKGFLEKLWMRNPGKNTWRMVPENYLDDEDE